MSVPETAHSMPKHTSKKYKRSKSREFSTEFIPTFTIIVSFVSVNHAPSKYIILYFLHQHASTFIKKSVQNNFK